MMTSELRPADWFPLPLHDGADHHRALAAKRVDTPLEGVRPFGEDGPELWVVYRYDDVATVLADEDRFSHDVVDERYGAVLGRSLVTAAPDVRRALRVTLRAAMPSGNELTTLVDDVVSGCLDPMVDIGERHADLVPVLAAQVPARVLVRLFGLEDDDWRQLAGLAAAAARFVPDPRAALRAASALKSRFRTALGGADNGGLLHAMAGTAVGGRRLDEGDLLASLLLFTWAGTETAVPGIANALYALLTHPDEATAVRADPDLSGAAADEALRWESPVQVTSRRAERDTELAGRSVPAGAVVLAHLGAANRDETRFAHPDRFDLRRQANVHLAFGHGAHRCFGAQVARAEVAGCVRAVLDRFPQVRLADASPPPEGDVVRCPRQLLVELR